MDYYIDAISWRNVPKAPVEMTDFSDFSACFKHLSDVLKSPKSYLTLRFVREGAVFIAQYYYKEPGVISVAIADEFEDLLFEGYELLLTEDMKFKASCLAGEDGPEDRDEIVKIILDYGVHTALGVQWAVFLLKERAEGTLKQYFDDLHNLEIH